MPDWTPLDDSPRAFAAARAVLKAQGNYTERALGYFVCKRFLHKFNCEIVTRGLDKLRDHQGRRVLLVPNHRSYLDPVIVHHVLALSGFRQPRVVALDFLGATPLAPIMKKCGAVFIRGSFADPAYREKMNQQLRAYTDNGEWLEFFLEGQRSSSGKQMEARTGLLNALTTDQPCVIYPINLSYERLIEDREFVSKTQGFNIKSALRSFLATGKGVGKMYFTVCDPIYTEAGANVRNVAASITKAIMRANVIFNTDLLAVTLLDKQETIRLETLQNEVNWLANALEHRGVYVVDRDIESTFRLLKHAISVKQKQYITIRDKTLLLYYRNRMLYTISDLVTTPSLLRREALYSPQHRPRGRDSKALRDLAKRAIEPTVFLYKYLLEQVQEGETSAKALRRSIADNPHCCYETVSNLLSVLKEDGTVTVNGDEITPVPKA